MLGLLAEVRVHASGHHFLPVLGRRPLHQTVELEHFLLFVRRAAPRRALGQRFHAEANLVSLNHHFGAMCRAGRRKHRRLRTALGLPRGIGNFI